MESVTRLEDKAVLGIVNDKDLQIAVADHRTDINWRNQTIKWSKLLKRFEKAKETDETQDEYFQMKKADQDAIKDVGGFVGGTLKQGRRKTENVDKRYLLTFDLDFAPTDFVTTMQCEAPYAWAIYSTHKHKPEAPRLRFIVPLDRPVDPDEYEAICRKLAEEIGIKYFDATTCQPARLMYWPSRSKGAAYVFEYNDDKFLKADDILAKYPDWHDTSYWPTFPDETRARTKRSNKQQDPLKKDNLVGAFCRTYTIDEAIATFLSDTYKPCENQSNRYTYVNGSTFGGLVVYDDGHCYSNHATDPAHGMDLNAFDLVRVHKFSDLDAESIDGTPSTRLPSYQAMLDLCRDDERVKETLNVERQAKAVDDFAGEPENDKTEEKPKEEDWTKKLTFNKRGELESTASNLTLIFLHDEKLKGIRYNELANMIEICSPVYWEKKRRFWNNNDDECLYMQISRRYTDFGITRLHAALVEAATRRGYNPIVEYLKGLPEWDGVARAEKLFVDYLGAQDSPYTREVTKRWLLAAVSRILRPGCKFDFVPVLSGPGGIGKSTLVSKLAGVWFSDSLTFEDMKDKTAAEKLQGKWIVEIGELKGMRKMDVESIKSFISRQTDSYRPSYGRVVEDRPRSCVLVGTTNDDEFLRDSTGNRRFWPVWCIGGTKNAWDITDEEVGQIWAEVMFLYDTVGETQLTLPANLEAEAVRNQKAAKEHDDRTEMVQEFLDREIPEGWNDMNPEERKLWLDDEHPDIDMGLHQRAEVCIAEIWVECFRQSRVKLERVESQKISAILADLGWIKVKTPRRHPPYGQSVKVYRRPVVEYEKW